MKTRELLLATLLGVAIGWNFQPRPAYAGIGDAADRIARAVERIADKMEKCP